MSLIVNTFCICGKSRNSCCIKLRQNVGDAGGQDNTRQKK